MTTAAKKPATKRVAPPTDSQGYVLWGDPDQDIKPDREARGRQQFHERLAASDRRREELLAGYPDVTIDDLCPSCGLPFRDDIERPYLNAETPEQTARRETEDAAYRERHKDCYGCRMSYGGPDHCGECCPHPSSPGDAERMAAVYSILAQSYREGVEHPETRMRWRVRLYCGHVVERTAHASDKDYRRAGSESECPECGTVQVPIAARAIGPKGQAKPPPKPKAPRQPSMAERIRALEAENARLRAELADQPVESHTPYNQGDKQP